jgi:release factor glutamine methyltransferase
MVVGHPTVREAVARAAPQLHQYDAPEAERIAELLASHVVGLPRLELYANPGLSLNEAGEDVFQNGVKRLVAGEPLQYVTGETEFRGHRIMCDRRALIPRPETEELVDAVLDDEDVWSKPSPGILDIGTGSGCIAISLALAHPTARVTAIDISSDALVLAAANAKRLGCADRIEFIVGDLLATRGPFDLMVSNPPYISVAEVEQLDPHIREHEPRVALDGGADGLRVIETIAASAPERLARGAPLHLEIGDGQAARVMDCLQRNGFVKLSSRNDLCGRERMVRGEREP